ncbi:proliferating cell nuclear antigen (pcna) [archaeon]|nr:proliferating cell nuclear antigen (pcna) [archaeon]
MIRLKKVADLQKSINALSAFISEGNLRFNEKGISFKAVDPSQVVLVDFNLPKKAFEQFKIDPSLVGVDLTELNKILQRCMPNDFMEMDLTDSELLVSLKGDAERQFRLPLLDINSEEPSLPQKSFDADLSINARVLKEALKDASLFGSSAVLKASKGLLVIESKSPSGQFKSTIKESGNAKIKAGNEVTSKYSLSFFTSLIKETAPEQEISLQLKTDSPMKIEYSLGEASLKFYLAHMIL